MCNFARVFQKICNKGWGFALNLWRVIGAQFRAGCFPREGETGGWDMTYKKGVYYALVLTF